MSRLVILVALVILTLGSIAPVQSRAIKRGSKDGSLIYDIFKLFSDKDQIGAKTTAFCVACDTVFAALKRFIAEGKPLEEIGQIGYTLCVDLHIMTPDVCQGIMDTNLDEIVYVVERTNHTAKQFCSFYSGGLNDCEDENYYEAYNWTIEIPGPIPEYNPPKAPDASAPKLRFLHMSDTHVDPQYTPGTLVDCNEPICCRVKFGQANENETAAGKWGAIGDNCDIPDITLQSMLEYVRDNIPIDFIIWTGDIPPHDIWNQTKEGNTDLLVSATSLVKQIFPSIPIFPSLGNHESEPVNAYPVPIVYEDYNMDYLYNQLNTSWRNLFQQFDEATILKGGYYSTLLTSKLRIISLNSNYGASENWYLNVDDDDPTGHMKWLVEELLTAEQNNEKVILISHLSPGSLTYTWSRNFNQVVNRFRNVISAQFYGHTHSEGIQIAYDERDSANRQPVSVSFLGPSLTTYGFYNPGFRIVTLDGDYDGSSFSPLDYEIFYLNLEEANSQGIANWTRLYTAKQDYGLSSLNVTEWEFFLDRLNTDEALLQTYSWNKNRRAELYFCDSNCKDDIICSARSSWAGAEIYCDQNFNTTTMN